MVNLHFLSHLTKHYRSATRIDVLHSPFVFDLYNSCIARQPAPAELAEIGRVWQNARRNNSLITQQDFGASGHKRPQRTQRVSYFARVHAKPKRLAEILYRMVRKYGYANCLELGTSLGYTTMHLAMALPAGAQVTTIEGAPAIASVAATHFAQAGVADRIRQVNGNFNEVLPGLLKGYSTIDLAFIDGNHTYEATMDYFGRLLPKVTEHSVLVFDDIYWSPGMTRAWEEIRQHPDVTVTVDLFFIGLVYFRKKQAREHFRLRVW